jgi:hypothetical protein
MSGERGLSYLPLDLAFVPGVGWIEGPEPEHYAAAIRHLGEVALSDLDHKRYASRHEAVFRWVNTYRRIAWSRR